MNRDKKKTKPNQTMQSRYMLRFIYQYVEKRRKTKAIYACETHIEHKKNPLKQNPLINVNEWKVFISFFFLSKFYPHYLHISWYGFSMNLIEMCTHSKFAARFIFTCSRENNNDDGDDNEDDDNNDNV